MVASSGWVAHSFWFFATLLACAASPAGVCFLIRGLRSEGTEISGLGFTEIRGLVFTGVSGLVFTGVSNLFAKEVIGFFSEEGDTLVGVIGFFVEEGDTLIGVINNDFRTKGEIELRPC